MKYSNRLFISIIMIFCAFQIICAQTSTEELPHQDNSQDWFWNKKIAGFKWDGLHYANRNDLDSMLRGYIGTFFTENIG